jgi:dTMP kinase
MTACSDSLFISVDGPSGVGKTATAGALANLLRDDGRQVHLTHEPSEGPIGTLARSLTETVHGAALACLYAADRYHHLDTEVFPHLQAGAVVITDRYVPSALVMQQLDGVDPEYLWRLNAQASKPHLAVILDADPAVVAERLRDRGPHNRLQKLPSSAHLEWHHYRNLRQRLTEAAWNIQLIDCSETSVPHVARMIYRRLAGLMPAGATTESDRSAWGPADQTIRRHPPGHTPNTAGDAR